MRPPPSAAIDERQDRDSNRQQTDKTQHDRAELVRRGPQRYRVGGVGPNAFHEKSPGPAAMARALGVSRRMDAGSSNPSAVMPRQSGASGTPRVTVLASLPLEYWITRFRVMTL